MAGSQWGPASSIRSFEESILTNARITALFGHVLVVEDNSIIAMQLEMILEDLGVARVTLAADADTALEALTEHAIDAALVDVMLDRGDSSDVVAALRERAVPHAIMTGLDSATPMAGEAQSAPVLNKPFLPQELETVLERLGCGQ